MFLINSRFPLFSATPQHSNRTGSSHHRAPLLPKLRGHFAEFLNHSSPERLSIFNLTTCVGLGYGPYTHSLEAFLDSTGSPPSTLLGLRITPQPICVADLPTTRPTRLHHQSTKWRGYLTASPHHLNHTSGPTTSTPPTLKKCQGSVSAVVSIRALSWAHMYGYQNINWLSIDYACRPRLRSRLTLGRRT